MKYRGDPCPGIFRPSSTNGILEECLRAEACTVPVKVRRMDCAAHLNLVEGCKELAEALNSIFVLRFKRQSGAMMVRARPG